MDERSVLDRGHFVFHRWRHRFHRKHHFHWNFAHKVSNTSYSNPKWPYKDYFLQRHEETFIQSNVDRIGIFRPLLHLMRRSCAHHADIRAGKSIVRTTLRLLPVSVHRSFAYG